MSKKDKVPVDAQSALRPLASSPFAGLAQLRAALPTMASAPSAASVKAPAKAALKKGPERAVVRLERKGRGGKEVTVVEQLELSSKEKEAWLKALKGALGCGGVLEEGALVVQGDHRERVRDWLTGRGVRRISVG